MKLEKVLFLPVEISTRELDSKLLIALEAAHQGFTVVLGSVQVLKLANALKTGIVFYKDASAPMESLFKALQSNDVRIVVHDEEGFVHLDDNVYMNARLRFNTIKYVDYFYTWGKHQANMVQKVVNEFSANTHIISTGHPRIDFLRSPFISTELNPKQKMILVNTKLAEYNHRLGVDGWMNILDSHSMIRNAKDRAFRLEQKEYKKELFLEYQKLIVRLSSEFKDYKIVIRPHPVENKKLWQDFCADFENVEVNWQGSISDWIEKSSVVIHTGCTTGLEAAIMKRPVISYKPIANSKFDIKLPDSVSNVVYSQDELISFIRNGAEKHSYEKIIEMLSTHIESLHGVFSYQKIVKSLVSIPAVKLINIRLSLPVLKLGFKSLDALRKLKRIVRPLEKHDPKFSTSQQAIEIKKSHLLGIMGYENQSVTVNQFSEEIYVLRKSGTSH
jgi:surface carbohydrate biosynthesis protein